MANQANENQMKKICEKAELMFMQYSSMRELLEQNGDKLDQEWMTNVVYRQAKNHLKPIKNEANPEQLDQFEMYKFLDPKSTNDTFQAFGNEIDSIRFSLAGAMLCYNTTFSTFNMAAFPGLSLSDYTEIFEKITTFSKIIRELHKLLL